MPKHDSISIHTNDLAEILAALLAKKNTQQVITIIDEDDRLIIRDQNQFLVDTIKKTVPDETTA